MSKQLRAGLSVLRTRTTSFPTMSNESQQIAVVWKKNRASGWFSRKRVLVSCCFPPGTSLQSGCWCNKRHRNFCFAQHSTGRILKLHSISVCWYYCWKRLTRTAFSWSIKTRNHQFIFYKASAIFQLSYNAAQKHPSLRSIWDVFLTRPTPEESKDGLCFEGTNTGQLLLPSATCYFPEFYTCICEGWTKPAASAVSVFETCSSAFPKRKKNQSKEIIGKGQQPPLEERHTSVDSTHAALKWMGNVTCICESTDCHYKQRAPHAGRDGPNHDQKPKRQALRLLFLLIHFHRVTAGRQYSSCKGIPTLFSFLTLSTILSSSLLGKSTSLSAALSPPMGDLSKDQAATPQAMHWLHTAALLHTPDISYCILSPFGRETTASSLNNQFKSVVWLPLPDLLEPLHEKFWRSLIIKTSWQSILLFPYNPWESKGNPDIQNAGNAKLNNITQTPRGKA